MSTQGNKAVVRRFYEESNKGKEATIHQGEFMGIPATGKGVTFTLR